MATDLSNYDDNLKRVDDTSFFIETTGRGE